MLKSGEMKENMAKEAVKKRNLKSCFVALKFIKIFKKHTAVLKPPPSQSQLATGVEMPQNSIKPGEPGVENVKTSETS